MRLDISKHLLQIVSFHSGTQIEMYEEISPTAMCSDLFFYERYRSCACNLLVLWLILKDVLT